MASGALQRNLRLAVFALFFLFRHGVSVLAQFRGVATRWLGDAARGYIQAVGVTVRAVVFGIVLTALAQGVLAGLGYWVAGIPAPALWGVITALISLIPFVGPVVWIGLSLSLLAHGETQAALGLFLWGALVVSWVDNLIRPLVISGPTRIPFSAGVSGRAGRHQCLWPDRPVSGPGAARRVGRHLARMAGTQAGIRTWLDDILRPSLLSCFHESS